MAVTELERRSSIFVRQRRDLNVDGQRVAVAQLVSGLLVAKIGREARFSQPERTVGVVKFGAVTEVQAVALEGHLHRFVLPFVLGRTYADKVGASVDIKPSCVEIWTDSAEQLSRRRAECSPEHRDEGAWALISKLEGHRSHGLAIGKLPQRLEQHCLPLPLIKAQPGFCFEDAVNRPGAGPNPACPKLDAVLLRWLLHDRRHNLLDPAIFGCGQAEADRFGPHACDLVNQKRHDPIFTPAHEVVPRQIDCGQNQFAQKRRHEQNRRILRKPWGGRLVYIDGSKLKVRLCMDLVHSTCGHPQAALRRKDEGGSAGKHIHQPTARIEQLGTICESATLPRDSRASSTPLQRQRVALLLDPREVLCAIPQQAHCPELNDI